MYLGNQPALSYTSFAKQDFTTSATTSYTLDNPVTNENEIALFINFVRQEPTTAYTASGTSLTLTSATSASDDMYCVFLGKAVQTVNPPNGSVGTAQIADLAVTSGKLASGVLPTNTPAWRATTSGNQTGIANNTTTKLNFASEVFDTNSAYDTSTSRFTVPSGQAGKYLIQATPYISWGTGGTATMVQGKIYKNGSQADYNELDFNSASTYINVYRFSLVSILDLSVGDYIEIYGNMNGVTDWGNYGGFFNGYKLIG